MARNDDVERFAVAATEATPLSTSPGRRRHSVEERREPRRRSITSVLAVASAILLALAIVRGCYHYTMDVSIPDVEDNGREPSERRDFVERHEHETVEMTFAAPPLHLPKQMLLGRRQNDEATPTPRTLRWGILGPGRIAHDFTATLLSMGCTVAAVAASHDDATTTAFHRAKRFARLFGIPRHYGKYDDLASDPGVDIVYVATTNHRHMEPTLLMLRGGKNVLVEKPTSVTYAEARVMYEEAEKRGLFLMTNHWTRFFPLVKYLRRTFLATSDATPSNDSVEVTSDAKHPMERKHDLGKALAMRGDFSFVTPLNPSDRYLNRTLGGGVTLDVGCYLIELALLAAYDHRQSHQLTEGMSSEALKEYLTPDGISATGHGVYDGFSFPVDVESSFSLRWGGGAEGIACDEAATDTGKRNTQSTTSASNGDFTMIGSFQASFRRPSTFEVEYIFEKGRILVHGPGNCPSEMTVYEHDERFGPVVRETRVRFPLPPIRSALLEYGRPNYPRPEGFAYVIDAIERCMAEKGVPGKTKDGAGCLELEENTVEEQLVTVEVTEEVLKQMGYFGKTS